MRWRWGWLGIAGVLALLVGGSVVWFTHQGRPSATASTTTRAVQQGAPPLTTAQAASLLKRLTSGNSAEVASAIAMPAGVAVPASTVHGLRTLAPVTVKAGSFTEVSSALATLSVTDRAGTRWLLDLIPVHGAWLVLDSVKR